MTVGSKGTRGGTSVGCVAAIDMLMSGPAADGMLMSGGPETLGMS